MRITTTSRASKTTRTTRTTRTTKTTTSNKQLSDHKQVIGYFKIFEKFGLKLTLTQILTLNIAAIEKYNNMNKKHFYEINNVIVMLFINFVLKI